MALQFIDGFDHYDRNSTVAAGASMTAKWDVSFFGGAMEPVTGGRFGGQALQVESTAGSAHVQKSTPTPKDEMVVGFAFLPKVTGSHITKIHLIYGAESAILQLDMSSGIASVTTTGGASATSAAGVLTSGVWHYIEFKVKVHETLGTIEVRVNEVNVASTSAADTGTTGGTITALRIESTSNLQTDLVDDLYWLDVTGSDNNDFLGDSRISVLAPKADGNDNNFTGTFQVGDTSNFQAVDETLANIDTDFVESGLIGAREDYSNQDLSDIGVTPTVIYGVQVSNSTLKTDVGTLKFKNEMTIAGVQFQGAEETATTGEYHVSTFIRDTDPSDSAAWTEAKVDAVGSGCTITFRQI